MKKIINKFFFLTMFVSLVSLGGIANSFPTKPIELICSTKAGSGAAAWCEMMANEMSQKGRLGVPITVLYKPGGANHEVLFIQTQKKQMVTQFYI